MDRADTSHHAAEIGELLFALVNVARMLGVDPETALQGEDGAASGHRSRNGAEPAGDCRHRSDSREFPGPNGCGW